MNQTHRSRLLLLELICDLALFGLCAVVCVTLLVQARGMSRESTHLTQAVYLAQEAAERLRSGGTWDESSGVKGDYYVSYQAEENPAYPGAPGHSILVYYHPDGQTYELVYTLPYDRAEEVVPHG